MWEEPPWEGAGRGSGLVPGLDVQSQRGREPHPQGSLWWQLIHLWTHHRPKATHENRSHDHSCCDHPERSPVQRGLEELPTLAATSKPPASSVFYQADYDPDFKDRNAFVTGDTQHTQAWVHTSMITGKTSKSFLKKRTMPLK